MERSVEEIAAKMDALNLWDAIAPYNLAVKPLGTAFPYFCTVVRGDGKPVVRRLLMLEGWQTLHDYVRTFRMDPTFGFYLSPSELPHLEVVFLSDGTTHLFRHDPGYMPALAVAAQRGLAARILWEIFGLMMRVEGDAALPMRFADDRAVFGRVETSPGTWGDQPLAIPPARPHVEKVVLPKADVKAAQDLPIISDEVLELDFRMLTGIMTREARPRTVYNLRAREVKTGECAMDCRATVQPETGLRGLWESMPPQVLREFVRRGRVPAEVRLASGRVFRLLRPICLELPLKLTLHDALPDLEACFAQPPATEKP